MPIRLILSIILLVLGTIFAGVNLDNKCDITFIFYTFKDIPVFMTVIISFAIGAILMIPFTLGIGRKKKKCPKSEVNEKLPAKQAEPTPESKTLFDFKIKREAKVEKQKAEKSKKEKKSLFGFGKKKENSSEESSDSKKIETNSNSENSHDAENSGVPI